jgi:chromosome segregation ATPase
MSEPQQQSQSYILSSNPCSAKTRSYKFLESIAQKCSAKENSVYRKILSLKTERQKLRERRKKVKAAIKEKYMQLESLETEIDSKDIEISRLESLKEAESESDSEINMR